MRNLAASEIVCRPGEYATTLDYFRCEASFAWQNHSRKDMDAKQIETEALALPEPARAGLVSRLLETIPPSDFGVSDDEIIARDQELETNAVQPLSHTEFVRRVDADRKR
jgi:hypothetical protein